MRPEVFNAFRRSILVREDGDTSRFQGCSEGFEVSSLRCVTAFLEIADGTEGDVGFAGQVRLCPSQPRPCRSALFW